MSDARAPFAAKALVDGTPLCCAVLARDADEAVALVEARLFDHGVLGTVTLDGTPDPLLAATLTERQPVSFGPQVLRLPVRSRGSGARALPDWLSVTRLQVQPLSALGDPDDVPEALQRFFDGPGQIFALLNSARVPNLAETVDSLGLEGEPLYPVDAASPAPPWLLGLFPCQFRRDLLTHDPDRPSALHLWTRSAGLLIRSALPQADLTTRLRQVARLPRPGDDGRSMVLPFWDPITLTSLLPVLEPEDAEALLGADTFLTLAPGTQTQVRLADPPEPGTTAPPARFRLSQRYLDTLARVDTRKMRARLVGEVQSLKPTLTQPEAERFVDLGLDVCASVGLQNPETITGYVLLSVLMGWDMTQRYAVAAPILDLNKPETARKTLIHHLLGRVATRT